MKRKAVVSALVLLLVAGVAAWAWYPPFRLLAMVLAGKSSVCPVANALRSRANLDDMARIKDRLLAGSRLVKEESGLELWQTPKGPFWIPKGNRFVLPFNLAEMDRNIYGTGEHFIHPGDVVLDCGASDGDFTREAIRAGAGKVISIEISPSSAECIRRNLAAEVAAGKVIVYPRGVWDREDRLTLNVDDTNFAANSVVLHPGSAHPAIEVPLTTIDRIVAELELPRVDFIKMDIEGAEANAIAGARQTLLKYKPRMAITTEHKPEDEKALPEAVARVRGDYQVGCGQCLERDGRIRADVLFFW